MLTVFKGITLQDSINNYVIKLNKGYFVPFTMFSLLFIVFSFFWISVPSANAGISLCTESPCHTDEGTCLDTQICSIDSFPDGPQCSWCGDFCADSCPSTGPVSIVPTMGQWGMIMAAILLGFFAVLKLRRRIET